MRSICASARCLGPAGASAGLVFTALIGAGCFSPTGSGGTSGADSDTTGTGVATSSGVAASSGDPTSGDPTSSDPTSSGVAASSGDPTTSNQTGTTVGDTDDSSTTAATATDGTTDGTTGGGAVCGDGVIELDEECDAGQDNGNNQPCTSKCKNNICGDGFPCASCGDQECDDGNINSGDDCSPACTFEHRVVFVTGGSWTGKELGGVVGADAKCNDAAKLVDALKGRQFRAWLSKDGEDAKTRIGAGSVPYKRTDGMTVALDADGLVSGMLSNPINRTETGAAAGGEGVCDGVNNGNPVWTGTEFDGTTAVENCMAWSMNGVLGRAGNFSKTGKDWTSCSSYGCGMSARLYCVQVVQ